MAITVSDIEQKEFAYKGQGYDPYDVDQYLDQICDEMVSLQERVDQLVAERERLEAKLAELGVHFVPSQANFVWLPAGERSDELATQFAERGISVRYFPGSGMRISIGLPLENDAVLEVAAKFAA